MTSVTTPARETPGTLRMALGGALFALVFAFFALVLVRTAWICDDAYITLRTIENFVTGHGLTWNIDERVQVYTHPLWMFLLSAAFFVTREAFLTPILLSVAVSLAAVLLMGLSIARKPALALFGALALLSCRAFVDYSTSGLENPLTHVLLAVFMLLYLRPQWTPRLLGGLAFVAALGVLNRMDTLLLYAPALGFVWLSLRTRRATAALVAGFLPFLLWELFSVVYYGFPFPNTAYAKLGTGLAADELARQGLWYFMHTLRRDPVTLPVIAAGIAWPVFARRANYAMFSLGVLLYMAYIVKIGGDFMGGRFFAAPLFVAVLLLVRLPVKGRLWVWAPLGLCMMALSMAAPYAPFTTGADFGRITAGFKDAHGIGDERRFYYQHAGLLKWRSGAQLPSHKYAQTGRGYRRADRRLVKRHGSVGFRGFFGGPKVHIIDYYALADPLLARLPALYRPDWRIGHFYRHTPPGYTETVASGKNVIRDRGVAEYYDHLSEVIRGPLFGPDRWVEIYKMNTGRYEHLIDKDAYRFPNIRRVETAALARVKPEGTRWNAPGVTRMGRDGIHVDFGGNVSAPAVELSVDHNDRHELLFMCGPEQERVGGRLRLEPKRARKPGLAVYRVRIPGSVESFSAIRVLPYRGDRKYAIGHLRLLELDGAA